MQPTPDFSAHRARLIAALEPDEAVLVFAAPHHLRNGDAEYRYRPDSDLFWLTGWTDPEAVVFLRPGKNPLTMFVQPKDPEREVWTGRREGTEGARERFGADVAFEIDALDAELPRLLQGVSVLHYAFAQQPDNDRRVMAAIHKASRAARRNGLSVPETFHHPSKLLHELRLHKSSDEIAVMRECARITADAHIQAMVAASEGRNEYEIEALIDHVFRSQGGTGAGYSSIVAGGDNANILHYIANNQPLRSSDLLLIDAGCEYQFYTADVTRTFPVSGTFTDAQKEVYRWVLKAQEAAIEQARPGVAYSEMHDASVRVLTEACLALGLLEGELDALIKDQAYKRYYMHGTGHWLGLDVHDAGTYARKGISRPLAPGMVVTVEPGLYIPAADTDAPERLRGIGIRIEDDILITDSGHENLTAACPKSIEDIEAVCQRLA